MIEERMMPADNLIIRLALNSDLDEIRDIYNHFVRTSIYTMDLDEKSQEEMKAWLASHTGRFPAYVATINNKIIGIASLSKWAERRGYYPSCEASIYLSPDIESQGQGDVLLRCLIDTAKENDFSCIISFMTSINKLARGLCKNNFYKYLILRPDNIIPVSMKAIALDID